MTGYMTSILDEIGKKKHAACIYSEDSLEAHTEEDPTRALPNFDAS